MSCAINGGCISDYIAVTFSLISIILLVTRSTLPCLIHKVPRPKGSSFWLPAVQIFASFNLLLSIVISVSFLRFRRRHWWQSCYVWAVWVEGPLGFGLLLSCRIVQASHLYYIFVRRHLPPIRSYFLLPLVLFPWVAGAALIHMRKSLNSRCHLKTQWIIPVVCLHALYIAALVAFTGAIRHIDFRFHELKDLWRGIIVSTSCIGIWVVAYVLNETHEEIQWLQVSSRFLLLTMASIFTLGFFSLSSSQPLLSRMSFSKKEVKEFRSMGQALGIPSSGMLSQRELAPTIDPNEPLDKLLLNKRFRQSFLAFADSCLAGESLHFYEEVHELNKIPIGDAVRRIYMARHIIEKYIVAGAMMEVNISHRTRQGILTTADLAQPDLFQHALSELVQLMKLVDPLRALRSSVSFGRYVSDLSAWEKFSCFANNQYLEEAEEIAKPGSVAEKKALLEAHFKKISAKKANVVTNEHQMSNVEKSSTDTLMVLESSETASEEINDEMQESRGPNVSDLDVERAELERDGMEVPERKTKTTDIAEKVIPSEIPKSLEDEGEHTKNVTVKQDKTPIIVSVKKNSLRLIRPKPGPIAEKKALLEAHFKKICSKKTEMGVNISEPSDVNNSCTDSLTVVKSSGTASKEVRDEMQNNGGLTVRDSDCGRGGLDKYNMKDMETFTQTVGILENVVTCQVSKPQENVGELTMNVSNKQEMIPIMNHDHQRNLISTSKKNSSVCSSRLFKDIRAANLWSSIKHGSSKANEEDKATQTSNKGEKSTLEKKTSILKSRYMPVDCSSCFSENTRSTLMIQKDRDRNGASVVGTLVRHSTTIELQK